MGENYYDLNDRLNWEQASIILACSKSALYRLVREEKLKANGIGTRYRWYSRNECLEFLAKKEKARG